MTEKGRRSNSERPARFDLERGEGRKTWTSVNQGREARSCAALIPTASGGAFPPSLRSAARPAANSPYKKGKVQQGAQVKWCGYYNHALVSHLLFYKCRDESFFIFYRAIVFV